MSYSKYGAFFFQIMLYLFIKQLISHYDLSYVNYMDLHNDIHFVGLKKNITFRYCAGIKPKISVRSTCLVV